MPDFPSQPNAASLPLFIQFQTFWSIGPELRMMQAAAGDANLTWTANKAVYIPFVIPWPYPVKRVFWYNGATLTGPPNADMGIYTASGTRIYSTGSTAQSGASAVQYVSLGTPIVLSPGRYFFAWASSGAVACALGYNPANAVGAMAGALSQATAFALPATATFATYSGPGVVECGITRTASGF